MQEQQGYIFFVVPLVPVHLLADICATTVSVVAVVVMVVLVAVVGTPSIDTTVHTIFYELLAELQVYRNIHDNLSRPSSQAFHCFPPTMFPHLLLL